MFGEWQTGRKSRLFGLLFVQPSNNSVTLARRIISDFDIAFKPMFKRANTGTLSLGAGSHLLGAGTPKRGGGSPTRGAGTEIRPVPAEFNHCAVSCYFVANFKM